MKNTQTHIFFFVPCHTIVVGYAFTLVVCVSVHLSYVCPSVFSFPDNNLSKFQWIFAKLGMCLAIVEIWLGLLMDKFCQCFTELSA